MGTNSVFLEVDCSKRFSATGFGVSTRVGKNKDGPGFGETPKEPNPVCEGCDDGGVPRTGPKRPAPEDELEGVPDVGLPKRVLD